MYKFCVERYMINLCRKIHDNVYYVVNKHKICVERYMVNFIRKINFVYKDTW